MGRGKFYKKVSGRFIIFILVQWRGAVLQLESLGIRYNLISVLSCSTWWLEPRCTSLRAILNKSWKQHPTNQQLYDHLPPVSKFIQIRWTRHAGNCRRNEDEPIKDDFLWTPTQGQAVVGCPAGTYPQQLIINSNQMKLLEPIRGVLLWTPNTRTSSCWLSG